MLSICGTECCGECSRRDDCGGCIKTDGRPFGGTCIAAERIKQGGFEAFKMDFMLIWSTRWQTGNPSNYWKIIEFIWEIKLKSPAVTDAMALLQTMSICLYANMDATGQIRR